MYIFSHIFLPTDAASSVAYFKDSRCADSGVCAHDPLLFTCELNEVPLLRVIFSTGEQETISLGDTAATITLPAGFTAMFLNISVIDDLRNISLTLSIENASLLNSDVIKCDDTFGKESAMAGCPLRGMFIK